MAANGDTAVIAGQPAIDPAGEKIFQAMTAKKATLEDLGVIKIVLSYVENGVHLVKMNLVTHDTLDKITNTIEDEAIG